VQTIFGVIHSLVPRQILIRILVLSYLALALAVFLVDPYRLTPHIRDILRGLIILFGVAFVIVNWKGTAKERETMPQNPLPVSVGSSEIQTKFITEHSTFLLELPKIQSLTGRVFTLTKQRYQSQPDTVEPSPSEQALRLAQIIEQTLAATAYEAFNDLLILAGNGRGFAAKMLLRVMYEHLVTAAFIAVYPDEAKPFNDNASVQKLKIWKRTLEVIPRVSQSVPVEVIEKLQEAANRTKAEQKESLCPRCHQPVTTDAWTRASIVQMAEKIDAETGTSWLKLYTTCFLMPTSFIHPTPFGLECRLEETEEGWSFRINSEPEAHDATMRAHGLMLRLLKLQNNYFQLGFDYEIAERWAAFPAIWGGALVEPPSEAES
jgi:Family of unknown function (DUF5677)